MQQRYEEELATLKAENAAIFHEQGVVGASCLDPTTITSTCSIGHKEDPCKAAHEGNTRDSKENSLV